MRPSSDVANDDRPHRRSLVARRTVALAIAGFAALAVVLALLLRHGSSARCARIARSRTNSTMSPQRRSRSADGPCTPSTRRTGRNAAEARSSHALHAGGRQLASARTGARHQEPARATAADRVLRRRRAPHVVLPQAELAAGGNPPARGHDVRWAERADVPRLQRLQRRLSPDEGSHRPGDHVARAAIQQRRRWRRSATNWCGSRF